MLDYRKSIDLIRGGLVEPRATWQSYAEENRGWQDTAVLLTLPLVIGSFLLSGILSWIFGGRLGAGAGLGPGGWLLSLVMALAGIAVAAFIFSYLAGVFKGRHDFNKGLAAVSLAAIPSYLGSVIAPLPYIGWLVALALVIVALVFLYRIVPLYLEVPANRRVVHFISALLATAVVMMILASLFGPGRMGAAPPPASMHDQGVHQGGALGGIQRYADMMERAEAQRYAAPADGRIDDAQMRRYLEVLRKTATIREEQSARMAKLQEKYADREPGLGDLVELSGGLGTLMGSFSAEMEVVMTGGGNWAEHQWVKERLRVARLHRDSSDAVRHNYALYQAHQDELQALPAAY